MKLERDPSLDEIILYLTAARKPGMNTNENSLNSVHLCTMLYRLDDVYLEASGIIGESSGTNQFLTRLQICRNGFIQIRENQYDSVIFQTSYLETGEPEDHREERLQELSQEIRRSINNYKYDIVQAIDELIGFVKFIFEDKKWNSKTIKPAWVGAWAYFAKQGGCLSEFITADSIMYKDLSFKFFNGDETRASAIESGYLKVKEKERKRPVVLETRFILDHLNDPLQLNARVLFEKWLKDLGGI